MGDRALVVFHDGESYSPTVYLHWSGSDMPRLLALWRERMEGRSGDLDYGAARFVGICHEQIEGNLSLGISNTKPNAPSPGSDRRALALHWKQASHGDAGVFLVNVGTHDVQCFGGYGLAGHDAEPEPEEIPVPQIHAPAVRPTLKEAQAMVGGLVQLLELPAGGQLLVNEDGIGLGLPLNAEAMRRWPEWGNLRGPVVYLTGDARWTD